MEFTMFDKHKGKNETPARNSEPEPMQPQPSFSAPQPAAKAAVIGPGIMIDGDISGSENLVIEGKVKGRIQLGANEVTVGKSGEVNADVSAKIIRVAGKVQGDLSGKEKVIISSTGNVRGNIVAPRMLLEDGAIFKGSIDMDPRESTAAQHAQQPPRPPVKPGSPQELLPETVKKSPDLALKSG
jgi:cytoskeletal protein CcmA (bactofilin family)